MDRTGWVVVVLCLLLLVGFEMMLPKLYPAHSPARPAAVVTPLAAPASPTTMAEAVNKTLAQPPAATAPAPSEKVSFLENDAVKITLTSRDASIREVELKKHEEGSGHIVLNEQARSNVLALSGWPGAESASFQVQEGSPTSVTYTASLIGGITWQRTYTLDPGYVVEVQDNLVNTGATDVTLPPYALSVGRAEPLRVEGHYQQASNLFLGSGWLGQKFHLVTVGDFNPSSFLWMVKTRDARESFSSRDQEANPLHWLGVENQFFAVLLTPTADRPIDHAEFHCYNPRDAGGSVPSNEEPDIEAFAYFPSLSIPTGQTVNLGYKVYAGPKEYHRLNALGQQQGEIMNYGILELIIVPMLGFLHFFYDHTIANYGLAIILLTLSIKLVTWPLQSIANRSGKRMQALAPKIKELQAKHKDHPEKVTTETFALYRDYGVSPFGGCLPALIQMPVFFSLYRMLQNAVELRGAHFLWVRDLTQPDTVAAFMFAGFHIAINPLPIMVTALSMVMMRMTPQIGDPQQAKIAQFMPMIFLVIFYNFAAALSLYYVINNCVSILQIYRNLRKPLPELKRRPKK